MANRSNQQYFTRQVLAMDGVPDDISMDDVRDIFEEATASTSKASGSSSSGDRAPVFAKKSGPVSAQPSGSGLTFVVEEGGDLEGDHFTSIETRNDSSRDIVADVLKSAATAKKKGKGKKSPAAGATKKKSPDSKGESTKTL